MFTAFYTSQYFLNVWFSQSVHCLKSSSSSLLSKSGLKSTFKTSVKPSAVVGSSKFFLNTLYPTSGILRTLSFVWFCLNIFKWCVSSNGVCSQKHLHGIPERDDNVNRPMFTTIYAENVNIKLSVTLKEHCCWIFIN